MLATRRSFCRSALAALVCSGLASISLAQNATETPSAATEKSAAAATPTPPAAEQSPPAAGKSQSGKGAAQIPRTGILHPNYNAAFPTLILIGDSTVKNGRDLGGDGLWGWGNPISAYFDLSKINVENQALGGTSSRTYYNTGHWERVSKLIEPGDFVMMQFGHNDNGGANNGRGTLRGNGENTEDVSVKDATETVHTFGWYLRQMIAETKAKGATPIVCSLIPRNGWKEGKVNRGTGSHATWAAEAAKQTDTPFIDLNGIIADHYDKIGQEAVKPFFRKEATHTGWTGAVFNAECVIEGIKALPNCKLKDYVNSSPAPKKPASDPTDG